MLSNCFGVGIPPKLVPFDLLFLSAVGVDWAGSCVDLDGIGFKKRDVTRLQVGEKDDVAQPIKKPCSV